MILADLGIRPRVVGKQGRARVPTRMHRAKSGFVKMTKKTSIRPLSGT